MFCLVYGFSNAASHSWRTPSTWGYLAAGVALLVIFAWWQTRAAHPLLPPRVVLDRNRGGAYLAVLIAGVGMFGIFLFLTYYLQTILGYSPVKTGVAFLPTIVMVMLFAQIANIFLMPRIGPKPLITVGMLLAAAGMMWLTRIGVHSSYATVIVGPMLVFGAGVGLSLPPAMNTGTFGVAPSPTPSVIRCIDVFSVARKRCRPSGTPPVAWHRFVCVPGSGGRRERLAVRGP